METEAQSRRKMKCTLQIKGAQTINKVKTMSCKVSAVELRVNGKEHKENECN